MAQIVDMAGKTLPREFLLAAACCRWPLSEGAFAAIRSAAADTIDWPSFLRVVRRQRIGGLVHNALLLAGIDVPPAIEGELAAQARRIARQNLLLAGETVRLQQAFDKAGIPVVVLKGTGLAQHAYDTFALKHGKDIDLLVPAERAEDALAYLEGEGYTLLNPARVLTEAQRHAVVQYGSEFALLRHGRAPQVELRFRLTDNMLLLAGIDPFASPQTIRLPDGAALRTMSEENSFVYLCVHGASHGWSRLKWLADLNALLARKNDVEIERLYHFAQNTGSGQCAGQALLLCQRLLGLRLPAKLEADLKSRKWLGILAAMAMDVMAGPDAVTELEQRPFGSTRVSLMQFLLSNNPAYFIAQCRIASVRLGDVVRYPLPRALHFLYPLLRLPLWMRRRTSS